MKIKLTTDIYQKLLEAGFKEGDELTFEVKKQKKYNGGATTQGDKPKPGEHPKDPPTVP